jgi:hypothetical protein
MPLTPGLIVAAASVVHQTWWNAHSGVITLVGTMVGLAGLILAVVFALRSRETKTLDWRLLTDVPIVTEAGQRAKDDEIRIVYKGTTLSNPRLVSFQLANTGKREITAEDFDGPVFVTTPFATMRSLQVLRYREGMRQMPAIKLDSAADQCLIMGTLFNRGDWVDFQLLIDEWRDEDYERLANTLQMRASGKQMREVAESAISDVRPGKIIVDVHIRGATRPSRQFSASGETFGEALKETLRLLPLPFPFGASGDRMR